MKSEECLVSRRVAVGRRGDGVRVRVLEGDLPLDRPPLQLVTLGQAQLGLGMSLSDSDEILILRRIIFLENFQSRCSGFCVFLGNQPFQFDSSSNRAME